MCLWLVNTKKNRNNSAPFKSTISMRRPENFASPTQPDSVDSDELSDLMQELKLLKRK